MEITNFSQLQRPEIGGGNVDQEVGGIKEQKGSSFTDLLRNSLGQVNNYQQQANQASRDLALGKAESVHKVMIAATKAETTLNLTTEIQSKVIDSYEEIMRMQV